MLNWIYQDGTLESINNISEDIVLECDDALLGDVDENSLLDTNDAGSILKLCSGIETPTERQKIIGDFNRDSAMDLLDAIQIMRISAN